eukprot:6287262-Amphidinium_carterae.2
MVGKASNSHTWSAVSGPKDNEYQFFSGHCTAVMSDILHKDCLSLLIMQTRMLLHKGLSLAQSIEAIARSPLGVLPVY